jgi:hypothetical protein
VAAWEAGSLQRFAWTRLVSRRRGGVNRWVGLAGCHGGWDRSCPGAGRDPADHLRCRGGGHARVAEMNRQVADNLDKIITALQADGQGGQEAAADAP